MRAKRKREYEDWAPWVRVIGIAVIVAIIFYLVYVTGGFLWKKLGSIKHSYENAALISSQKFKV